MSVRPALRKFHFVENTLISRDMSLNPNMKRRCDADGTISNKKLALCTPLDRENHTIDDKAAHESLFRDKSLAHSLDFSTPEQRKLYDVTSPAVPEGVMNIDDQATRSPVHDPTYAACMFVSKMKKEVELVIQKEVLGPTGCQPEITAKAYGILTNYLHEIAMDNGLQSCSFVAAVHLLDRLLALRTTRVKLAEFQLYGCACLLIASKLEDIYPPTPDGLVRSSGDSFDKTQLFRAEVDVLNTLRHRVQLPTRYEFAQRFGAAAALNKREQSLANYLVELSFADFGLTRHLHSKVAAAAVHLALQMTRSADSELWGATLRYFSTYEEADLVEVVLLLAGIRYGAETCRLRNIPQKYCSDEHHRAAEIISLPPSQVRFSSAAAVSVYKAKTAVVARLDTELSAANVSL